MKEKDAKGEKTKEKGKVENEIKLNKDKEQKEKWKKKNEIWKKFFYTIFLKENPQTKLCIESG